MGLTETNLQILWYLVLCAAVIMYTVLDGFDLGVGSLHLMAKSDHDRRVFLNAIGPVWDGNEVWLIIIGGALFAGFPAAFGAIFSAFYTPTMVFLAGIIFRAVAIEFRSKITNQKWRNFWDVIFSVSSIVIAFGAGVLLACLVRGIPIDGQMVFQGGLKDFISFYSILVGLMTVFLFMLHGLVFLLMKTEGDLHNRLRKFVTPVVVIFGTLYAIVTIDTMIHLPYMMDRFKTVPFLYLIPVLAILSMVNVPYQVRRKNDGWAFIFSSISITLLFVLFGIGTYPVILRSTIDPSYSLTMFNTSSEETTLKVILMIALIGIPLVLAYGFFLYRIFRGKVKIDSSSY
jgi:cytochrome d ubiquinol oxidase subunit II